jgi:hypothetical protein
VTIGRSRFRWLTALGLLAMTVSGIAAVIFVYGFPVAQGSSLQP